MKTRFNTGTDVAMVGAWDAARGAQPFSVDEFAKLSETLEADAERGDLFVIHTHADGGGPVDVYVDEPVPAEVAASLTPLGDECVLGLPSGSLSVDGVEHYRARKPDRRQAERAVSVPPGDYMLRCYVAKDEEHATARSERDLAAAVGADDMRHYDRVTRLGCLTGLLLLLLFPLLAPFIGVKWAITVALVSVIAFFNVREWLLRRNARFVRLRERIVVFRLEQEEATFVFELRRIQDREGRGGGTVSLV